MEQEGHGTQVSFPYHLNCSQTIKRTKSVLTHFCQWLVDDQSLLVTNPLRGLVLSPPSTLPLSRVLPRGLSPTQRGILLRLLHHWFRDLKNRATPGEREQIGAVRFQDVRDDFAYRTREAGWTEEEVAYYLGYVTAERTLSLRTAARFTQLTRAQIKEKLKILKG